ncbi:MAG: isopentenyl phosphate kinase, partial [Chloroflexota bacterium]|jgi:isopentenyl phosphate kinase
LRRLAAEITEAFERHGDLKLVLGHGSGSFGHVAAARFDTRSGVRTTEEWLGYVKVSDAAARLNREVCGALLAAGLPAISLQPSASAHCRDGRINHLAVEPVQAALKAGVLPVLYGDVAFDAVRGGTIISTEEIMSFLAVRLKPTRLLLAGETEGVLDEQGRSIPELNQRNLALLSAALGGSRGTDVTGGMASKVRDMLDLVQTIDGLTVRIFSGLSPGNVRKALLGDTRELGTLIRG